MFNGLIECVYVWFDWLIDCGIDWLIVHFIDLLTMILFFYWFNDKSFTIAARIDAPSSSSSNASTAAIQHNTRGRHGVHGISQTQKYKSNAEETKKQADCSEITCCIDSIPHSRVSILSIYQRLPFIGIRLPSWSVANSEIVEHATPFNYRCCSDNTWCC